MLERKLYGASESKPQAKTTEEPGEVPDRSGQGVTPPCDEKVLFGGERNPRLFGEGGYAEGGSNEEGNYEARDTNPQGSFGNFSDAGGFGATQLLGDETLLGGSGGTSQASTEKSRNDEKCSGS